MNNEKTPPILRLLEVVAGVAVIWFILYLAGVFG